MFGVSTSSFRRKSSRQPASLALACLAVFLLLLPLTLESPGLPVILKADAAAFYLSALSLVQDGDLVCEDTDVRRLFREYPASENLLLMGRGGEHPVYFGVPIVYPVVAAPFAALFGARGLILLNAALFLAMIWMGATYLRRYNGDSLALFFAASFFFLSTGFLYVFWPQAEVLLMACVMASFFWLDRGTGGFEPSTGTGSRRLVPYVAGSAAALAVASYSKPMLVVLALPALYFLAVTRAWKALVAYILSGLLSALALMGAANALTGEPWPYFAPRLATHLDSPVRFMERKVENRLERRVAPGGRDARRGSADQQIRRAVAKLQVTMVEIARDAAPEFLVGRHGGFLVYMPFAALAVFYFVSGGRRSVFRWLLLASAILSAILFVTIVRGNWLGGGGFVGNRYYTAVYPCFLFLVRKIRPPGGIVIGFAAAAVFLGPLIFTSRSAPSHQIHVRNRPFPHLPIEWSLERTLPGSQRVSRNGVIFRGRRDDFVARGDEIWIAGARTVEMFLLSAEPERDFIFDLRNLAPDNEIEVCLQSRCRTTIFGDVPPSGSVERLVFEGQTGARIPRSAATDEGFRYRLLVTSLWGERPRWRSATSRNFYLGAALTFLGSREQLETELYRVQWNSVGSPGPVQPGTWLEVPVVLRNTSQSPWPVVGATRVRIGYRWRAAGGGPELAREGRAELGKDPVGPSQEVRVELRIRAPEAPGSYLLELDLVRERVQWFSAADDDNVHRLEVEVVAPPLGRGLFPATNG